MGTAVGGRDVSVSRFARLTHSLCEPDTLVPRNSPKVALPVVDERFVVIGAAAVECRIRKELVVELGIVADVGRVAWGGGGARGTEKTVSRFSLTM